LELLQNIGIAPIFLMALLLALGPNNQSSDFMNQESCNERGLLQIRAPKNCPPKKAFNSGLIQRNGVWNLEIEIPISDNLTWTSTYQKIDEDKAISIYLWKNHLPAIIESAFCEKPLKRIISHTIIDVYDLIVRKIETQGDNMIFTVTDSSPKLSLSEASIFLPVKYL